MWNLLDIEVYSFQTSNGILTLQSSYKIAHCCVYMANIYI